MPDIRQYLERDGVLRPATSVILISTILTLLGIIMIGSVSTGPETTAADPYAFAYKQVKYASVGILIAFIAARVPIDWIAERWKAWIFVTWGLLALVLVVGSVQLGAKRWIALPGGFHFQPSEVAKITLVIACSAWAATRARTLSDFRNGFLPGMGLVLGTCVLVILEKDMGTTAFLFALGVGLLWACGARFWYLALTSIVGLGVVGVVAWQMGSFDYVSRRLQGYASASGSAHDQVRAGLDAMRTGGLFGTGLGEGQSQLGFVPKIHNDFIVAAIGEQLGLIGVLMLVVAYIVLFHAGWRIAQRAKNRVGFGIAFGVTLCIAMQAIFNLMVATGLVPPKGINLPFVSYGGSSLLVLGGAIGLLLRVAHEGEQCAIASSGESAKVDPEPSREIEQLGPLGESLL